VLDSIGSKGLDYLKHQAVFEHSKLSLKPAFSFDAVTT
jgi:hypothetical protein